MNDTSVVEDLLRLNIMLYYKDAVSGNNIRELPRLLRLNNHIRYVSNMNAVFQSFRRRTCDTFFKTKFSLERHLTTCSERVKIIYSDNVYQIQETLFDKLESFVLSPRKKISPKN